MATGPEWLLAVILGLGVFAPATGARGEAAKAADSSRDLVRAELRAVCERLTSGDNPFFGRAVPESIRMAIGEAVDAPPETRIRLHGWLASTLFRQDRVTEAIDELERARALLDLAAPNLAPTIELELRRTVLRVLARAHLQLAEDRNCVARHVETSCILPLADEAIHTLPEEARSAGDLYQELLELDPPASESIQARWLFNLSRMLSGDYPAGVPERFRLPADSLSSSETLPRFPNVAPELGIDAMDLSGGAVMEDFDGDGLLDLVSSTWDPCSPMTALRNDGRGGFVDVTVQWGLADQLGAFNLVPGDLDGDGAVDIFALRGGWLGEDGKIRNSLLRNDLRREAGRFVDVTVKAGIAYPAYPTQTAAWADYDGDGDLDLYVGNEAPESSVTPQTLPGTRRHAYPSQLFRNNGDGTFTDVAREAGVTNDRFAKGVAWGDYDDDGDSDLYVSNIGPNRLYRDDGPGEDGVVTFTDVAPDLGVDEPAEQSFATWFFDWDNDGDLDLWVNRYGARIHEVSASYLGLSTAGGHPALFENDGGRFTEVSAAVGLDRPLLPMGANHGDLDNDGFPDVYLGTGVPDPDALMPNVMYRNDRGRRFVDVTFAGGFGHLQKGHGIAFGDLDNDGDQELFQQMGGAFPYDAFGNVLYENPGPAKTWIVLRLEGRKANRFGVGARIEVQIREGDETRSVHTLVGTGGSFGASSLQQEIGLGDADSIERIVIRWPGSGTLQHFDGVAPNRYYRAVEGEPELLSLEAPAISLGSGDDTTHPRSHREPEHAAHHPAVRPR